MGMAAIIPTWAETVGAMVENGAHVQVDCTRCKAWQVVDVAKLLALKGPDYSLINRRCRCRLTPGCLGWNRFHYRQIVMRPLWRVEDVMPRWFGE